MHALAQTEPRVVAARVNVKERLCFVARELFDIHAATKHSVPREYQERALDMAAEVADIQQEVS